MQQFSHWLAATPASVTIQNVLWIIPTLQTIHILAVAIVISSIAMINLRILNLAGRSQTMSQTAHRFLPWIWTSLMVLAATGIALIVGEPARDLNNVAFWTKMALLVIAIVITLVFQRSLRRHAPFWEQRPANRKSIKAFAVATFAIWCVIMIAGRWIAYVKVINFLMS